MTTFKTENLLSENILIYEGLAKTSLPPFCSMIPTQSLGTCLDYENITIRVKIGYFEFYSYNYVNVYLKTISMPMAHCVHNGENETKVGLSQLISISFHDNRNYKIF